MNLSELSFDKIRNVAEDVFNQAKPKTETETKLYEILSHKNWGSSSSLMNEIARDTYDYDKFGIISTVMWESMENQRPAAWRVVFKGLTLLEHLVKNGSERCVDDARNHGHSLRALTQFNYYEGTIDRGQGVREKAKQMIEMLSDDERVREERMKARKLREKFGGNLGGVSNRGAGGGYGGYGNNESNWDSGRGDSGYGEGGIDSARSSRRADSGYSGRYDNERDTRGGAAAAAPSAGPTFATLPPADKKKKKKKKKNAEDGEEASPAPAAPQADLLDFGGESSPAPAVAVHMGGDDFDDFDTLRPPAPAASDPFAAEAASEEFGAFDSAPVAASSSIADPFAPTSATAQPAMGGGGGFDLFGGQQQTGIIMNNNTMMNNGMNSNTNIMVGNMAQLQAGMASMSMGGNATGIMGGGGMHNGGGKGGMQQKQPAGDDDDFGDFETATGGVGGGTSKASTAAVASSTSDPLGKLISLDGLSKNDANKKANTNKPAQPAAAAYQQEQQYSMGMGTSGGANSIAAMDPTSMGMGGRPAQQIRVGQMNASMMGTHMNQGAGIMSSGMGNMQGGMGMGINSYMSGMQLNQGMMGNPQMMGLVPGMGGMMNPQMGAGGMAMNPNMMRMQQQGGMGVISSMNSMGGMNMQQGMGMNTNMNSMGGMNMQQGMGMGGHDFSGGFGGMNNTMSGSFP